MSAPKVACYEEAIPVIEAEIAKWVFHGKTKQKNPGNPDISWLSIEDENIAKCIFRFVIRMKEKVKQQEMELNASNPQVFLEAQSATKQEVLC